MKHFLTYGDYVFIEGADKNQLIIMKSAALAETIGKENKQAFESPDDKSQELREEAC